MSILLTIVAIIVVLIALVLLIAAFTRRDFLLEKEITIGRPKPLVFDFIRHIRNQEQYSVWILRDPAIKIMYSGTDGTPGFISSWESENRNVGVGAQEIMNIREGESIEVEIRFKKPFEGTNRAVTMVQPVSEGATRVRNIFSGRSKFPMNIMNLLMEKLVGKDMAQNLVNLKKLLENQ